MGNKKPLPPICWSVLGKNRSFFITTCTNHFLNNLSQCSTAEIKLTPTWSLCVHNVGSAVALISLHLLSSLPPFSPRFGCSIMLPVLTFSFTLQAAWIGCYYLEKADAHSLLWPHFTPPSNPVLFTRPCTWYRTEGSWAMVEIRNLSSGLA